MSFGPLSATDPNLTVKSPADQLPGDAGGSMWGKDGFSFKDLVDIVNPLQQLPIVGDIYRSQSGDTISPASRIAGGALLGGPIGFVSAVFNQILQSATGKDLGEHVIAALKGDDTVQVAQNESTGPSPTNLAAYAAYQHTQNLLA